MAVALRGAFFGRTGFIVCETGRIIKPNPPNTTRLRAKRRFGAGQIKVRAAGMAQSAAAGSSDDSGVKGLVCRGRAWYNTTIRSKEDGCVILSASRRTDIPAHYADWFMRRLRAGEVLTRNPLNPTQLRRVPLSPETVDCVVFWTKDARPLLPLLPAMDEMGYRFCIQWTLTPYGPELEPGFADKAGILEAFCEAGRRWGRLRLLWRYDPILVNDTWTVRAHQEAFARLCQRLGPYTETVTVSFVDLYAKLKSPLVRAPSPEETAELAEFIGQTARAHGLRAQACCEALDLRPCGIAKASCIDRALLERICGCELDLKPDKNQRPGCGCYASVDIGMYDSCPSGCVYCYANRSRAAVEKNRLRHDPEGALLLGAAGEDERAVPIPVKSHRRGQLRLTED